MYILLLFLSALAAGSLALFVWRRRDIPGGRALLFLCLCTAGWVCCAALAVGFSADPLGVVWGFASMLAGQLCPPFFLLFALQYARLKPAWLSGWRVAALWLFPLVFCVGMLTQAWHCQAWVSAAAMLYAYGMTVLGIWALLVAMYQWPRFFSSPARWLLLISFLPLLGNALFALWPDLFDGQDPTPLAFCLAAVALIGTVLRYRPGGQIPLALDTLLENLQDGVLLLDIHRNIVEINQAARQLLGLDAVHLGQPASETLKAWPEIASLCQEKSAAQCEIDLMANRQRFVDARLTPLFDTERNAIGALMTLHDITAQKWVETDLRASQERYRTLVENQAEGIGIVDANEVFTFANPAAERIFGVPAGHLEGRSLLDFLPPEKRAFLLKQTEKRRRGEKGSYTMEIIRPDRSTCIVDATAAPQWGVDGQFAGSMGIFRDVTGHQQTLKALRESEEKFRAVIAQSSDAFMLVDGRGVLVSWNNACEQLTGLPATQVLGQPFWEIQCRLLAPEQQTAEMRQQLQAAVQQYLGARGGTAPLRNPEERLRHTDGSYRYIHRTVSRIRTASGILLCYACRDVTDIHLAEEALQARQSYLTLTNEITRLAIETSDFEDMLQRITDRVAEWFGADGCVVILWDSERGAGHLAGVSRRLREAFPAIQGIPFGEWLLFQAVLKAGRPVVVDDAAHSSYISPRLLAQFPVCSLLGLPLVADGHKLGALLIAFHHIPHAFLPDEVRLGEQVAAQIALSLAKARLFQSLRQREEAYRSLAENLPGIVYRILLDEAGRIIFYNDQLWVLTGYRPGELQVGEFGAIAALIVPEDQPAFYQARQISISHATPFEVEYRIRHKSGQVRHFVERGALMLGANGLPLYLDGVIFDVTERKMVEQAEREQRRLAEALRDTAAALNSTLELDAVFDAILGNLGRVLAYEIASLMLMENGMMRIVRSQGFAEHGMTAWQQDWTLPVTEFPNLLHSIESRLPVVIPDTVANATWVIWPQTAWIRSHIHAPIQQHDQVIGFLNLDSSIAGYFTEQHILPLKAFADQAAIALENARLYAESRRRADQMDTLYRIGLAITSGLELDRVLHSLHEQCQQIARVDAFTIALYDAETRIVEFPYVFDRDEHLKIPSRLFEEDSSPGAYVFRTHKLLYLPETEQIDPALPIQVFHHGKTHSRSYLGVPLLLRDQALGVLSIQSYQPHSYTAEQIRLLETIATQAAIAIENARLYAEVKRRSIVDELTGLYNRRGLLIFGKREIERLRRSRRSLTVLFLDIDNFRNFNNQYSYAVGDQVLRSLADCLRANARETDLLGRYGGEEFVVLLPDTDVIESRRVAERLRSEIAAMSVPTDWGNLSVTVSIGIARLSLPTGKTDRLGWGDAQALSDLFDRAGQMLHQAKESGKNCIAVEPVA